MGAVFSCCKDETPGALQADPRAALRAGGRIRVEKNVTEDPRAPLLTKSLNSLHKNEAKILDKELEDLVSQLSGGDSISGSDFDFLDDGDEANNLKGE